MYQQTVVSVIILNKNFSWFFKKRFSKFCHFWFTFDQMSNIFWVIGNNWLEVKTKPPCKVKHVLIGDTLSIEQILVNLTQALNLPYFSRNVSDVGNICCWSSSWSQRSVRTIWTGNGRRCESFENESTRSSLSRRDSNWRSWRRWGGRWRTCR